MMLDHELKDVTLAALRQLLVLVALLDADRAAGESPCVSF
jgi:hypothetical protein